MVGLVRVYLDTIWLFNIAMDNGPFIDDFPFKTTIYSGFSMAMLNNQRVPSPSPHLEHLELCNYTFHFSNIRKLGQQQASAVAEQLGRRSVLRVAVYPVQTSSSAGHGFLMFPLLPPQHS